VLSYRCLALPESNTAAEAESLRMIRDARVVGSWTCKYREEEGRRRQKREETVLERACVSGSEYNGLAVPGTCL
jgi:hypothetical protein